MNLSLMRIVAFLEPEPFFNISPGPAHPSIHLPQEPAEYVTSQLWAACQLAADRMKLYKEDADSAKGLLAKQSKKSKAKKVTLPQ